MSSSETMAAIAPNHLGDGVMALPALTALADRFALTIYAPSWGRAVYGHLSARVVPRGSVAPVKTAVLFAPSLRAAWQGRAAERVVGLASDGRGALITHAVCAGAHRRETYAALARAVGCEAVGDPIISPPIPSAEPLPFHVGLNPISASGEVVEWPGFAELAERLPGLHIAYGGPDDHDGVAAALPNTRTLVGLPLPRFMAALSRCVLFISNDSGAAHLARAVGVPTLVVFGSTTAWRTGPAGAVAIEGPDLACRPCYRKRCAPGHLRCLRVSVHEVLATIHAHWPRVLHG